MSARAAYLDTSAFLKLVVEERESAALARFLAQWPERTSSTLLRTEAVRALRRSGNPDRVGDARRLMRTLHLVRADDALIDRAADLEPAGLRSLDAIHLAAAMTVGDDLGMLVTYDERLAAAARVAGLGVSSPA